jgi:hypothetical protein
VAVASGGNKIGSSVRTMGSMALVILGGNWINFESSFAFEHNGTWHGRRGAATVQFLNSSRQAGWLSVFNGYFFSTK